MQDAAAAGPLRFFDDLPDPRAANMHRRSFDRGWDKSGKTHMVSLFTAQRPKARRAGREVPRR